jgi:hypothetical protein
MVHYKVVLCKPLAAKEIKVLRPLKAFRFTMKTIAVVTSMAACEAVLRLSGADRDIRQGAPSWWTKITKETLFYYATHN